MTILSDFIGIPYRDRGSSFSGCDCWGLVWLFHTQHLHSMIPRYEGYASAEGGDIPDRIRQGWAEWQQIQPGQTKLGDVLALRVGRNPVHCGVVLDGSRMLHILEGRESCIEPYDVGFWRDSIVRIGRWKS